MKKTKIFIFTTIIISMLMSSCTFFKVEDNTATQRKPQTSTQNIAEDEGPIKGGVIRLFSTFPDTLNPLTTKNTYVVDFLKTVFEGLVTLNANQKPAPMLAESWSTSQDGLIWSFNLRKGVKFHDGEYFTAADVEYTILALQNEKVDSIYKKNVENIESVLLVDNYTINITLIQPDSFTPEKMIFPIIPRHLYYEENDFVTLDSKRSMNPIGTGPYRFKRYYSENLITLGENLDWWGSRYNVKNGLTMPFIKELDIMLYKNAASAISAIQSKDIDVAFIDTEECGNYFGRYDLTVNKYQNRKFEGVALNVNKGVLVNKSVRQAISYAINKTKIVGALLPGKAMVADYPLINSSWLSNSGSVINISNVDKAKGVLESDGWKKNSSGIYSKSVNGNYSTLDIKLTVNSDNSTRIKVANKIANQLKKAGIKVAVEIVSWEQEQYLLKKKYYDMAIIGYEITSVPDLSFAYSTDEIATWLNISGYSDPIVDDYLDKIKLETNLSKKKILYDNMLGTIKDNSPYVGLYFYNDAVLYSKRIMGDLNPCFWNRYYNITGWYLNVLKLD